MACEDLAREALEPCPFVRVPRSKLQEARDLLTEKIRGSNARSPNHNARLVIDELLDSTAYDAIGSGVKARELEWTVERQHGFKIHIGRGLGLAYEAAIKAYSPGWIVTLGSFEVIYDASEGDEETAKAAAQADFERRVLACLSHTAAGAGPVGEAVAPKITADMVKAFYEATEVTREGSIRNIKEGLAAAIAARPVEEPGEVGRLRTALRNIAEGNLGSEPWQANYGRIRDIARAALTGDAQEAGK